MKVLALNCGSSSVKYQLFDWSNQSIISKGLIERIGQKVAYFIRETVHGRGDKVSGYENKIEAEIPDHTQALMLIIHALIDDGVVTDASDISVVAHRVVHGGQKFTKSVLITDEVVKTMEELSFLAPLHNPANLSGITAARNAMPNVPQVGTFDTAFHQTMPDYAYHYALPSEWYDKFHVRRYGFHGTSHLYVSKRAAAMLNKPASECNLITMHIGNGVSVTAIKNGLSVDTSMGMTPLEGAIMGTRCGDIDPSIPIFMQGMTGLSAQEIYDDMNKRSGLLGITSDRFIDRRDIARHAAKNDERCKLAMEMEGYRLKQYIGKYMATLGSVDAVVFTAGAGENFPLMRELATKGLDRLGLKLNRDLNNTITGKAGETDLSAHGSKIKIFMIPTNEEIVLVEDAIGVLEGTYTDHMHYPYSFL